MHNIKVIEKHSTNIAIIGFGPKGLYGLERLLAEIVHTNFQNYINIYLFNANPYFGSGNVYQPNQPDYFIMNYANHNINMWRDDIVKSIVEKPLTFIEWLNENGYSEISKSEFSSRRTVGKYLKYGFNELKKHCPENVEIIELEKSIADIEKINEGYKVIYKSETAHETFDVEFSNILITTGHLGSGANFQNEASNQHSYINFIYPVEKKFSAVQYKLPVAIKGFGLTAIDAILALTEGRGGQFTETANDTLQYRISGNEPASIAVFSRTGLPMFPRDGFKNEDTILHYFNNKTLREKKYNKPYNFEKELLPLIKQEYMFAYYKVLCHSYGLQLKPHSNFSDVIKDIDQFHNQYPNEERFNFEHFLNPFQNKDFNRQSIYSYLKFLLNEAEKGIDKSPTMSAAATWRKISPFFNKIYSCSGLDGASQQLFDQKYQSHFNRISYGPPITNYKKLIALVNAGILNFSLIRNPDVKFNKSLKIIALKSEHNSANFSYLIDARIPKNPYNNQSLFSNLKIRGLVAQFKNDEYQVNCPSLTSQGHPININGEVEKRIVVYGTPTEGITYDNDTLSRTRNDFASSWSRSVVRHSNTIKNKQPIKETLHANY